MGDQNVHLFEPAGRVMNIPHILSTAKLPAKRAGNSGAGRQRTGVGAMLQKQRLRVPSDRAQGER